MSHRLSSNNYNHYKSTNEVVFTYTSSLDLCLFSRNSKKDTTGVGDTSM